MFASCLSTTPHHDPTHLITPHNQPDPALNSGEHSTDQAQGVRTPAPLPAPEPIATYTGGYWPGQLLVSHIVAVCLGRIRVVPVRRSSWICHPRRDVRTEKGSMTESSCLFPMGSFPFQNPCMSVVLQNVKIKRYQVGCRRDNANKK